VTPCPSALKEARETGSKFYIGKACLTCGNTKRYTSACKCVECAKVEYKRYNIRARYLKSEYGISEEDYERLYSNQSGKCAICKRAHSRLHIDHDHSTGHIRELLCGSCNRAIGLLKEDVAVLKAAARYIERHSAV
jgi:hypothetical protein